MKVKVEKKNFIGLKTDLLVVNIHDGKIDNHSFAHVVDKKLNGELKKIFKNEKFTGQEGEIKLIHTQGKLPCTYVAILGLGDKKKFNLEVIRKGAGQLFKLAKQINAKSVVTAVHGGHLGLFKKGECAQAVVEGISLAAYDYFRYVKKSKDHFQISELSLLCPDPKKVKEVEVGAKRGEVLAKGVCCARDLVNEAPNHMTPLGLAKASQNLKGVTTKVYKQDWIKKMKMGAYLGVAQGSINPPAFIEMHYKPKANSKKKIVIIGKGITFDSGGLSLKPPKFQETMKDDMAGAAAVVGLMSIIKDLNPKVEIWGMIAAAENMPGGKAQRPGDVVTSMSGKTIEVLNTDAEGRLTLADALTYADKKKPDLIIDMATLTGACMVALGNRIAGAMGNDQDLIDDIIDAGNKSGEPIWQLPLPDEYKAELKSHIADLRNIGGPYGGTITAGLFLQEFVGKNKWVHLDIAGPSWTEKPHSYEKAGGTGVMVRTLAEFLARKS